MAMYQDVPVKCKKCQKMAPSSTFTIDPYLKVAVCGNCAKESRSKPKADYKEYPKPERKNDFNIEREIDRIKAPAEYDQLIHEKKDVVKIKCNRCNHIVDYDRIRQRPSKCSYCGTPVKYN